MAAIKGLDAKTARRRIDELLEVVNLVDAAKRPLGGYSGGMKQRVGIAQALLNDPQLLIVDEPTVGLDPEERVRFRNLLSDLSGERIILLSTHIVSDVEATATEIVIINKGRKLQHAAPEKLLAAAGWQGLAVGHPLRELPALKQKHIISGTIRRENGVQVRVVSDTAPTAEAQPDHSQPRGCLSPARLRKWSEAMKTLRILYHLARADFLERTRRYSFLVMLGLVMWIGYLSASGQFRMRVPPDHIGIINSAWVGGDDDHYGLFLLGWVGFYIVKGSVSRDYTTGVGQIMATTPLSRPLYMLGKWLSNFAVLGITILILMLKGILMNLLSAPRARPVGAGCPAGDHRPAVHGVNCRFRSSVRVGPWLRGGLGQYHLLSSHSCLRLYPPPPGESQPSASSRF